MIKAKADYDHRPVKHDSSVYLSTYQDIQNGKIQTPEQIDRVFTSSVKRGYGLSESDHQALRKELDNRKSPDGERYSARKGEMFKAIRPQITKSNPLLGKLDPSGDAQMYNFQHALDQQEAELRKAGKDPAVLLDPNSPEFFGRPERVAPFKTDINESLKNVTESIKPKPVLAPDQARKEGESFGDWKKRTGR